MATTLIIDVSSTRRLRVGDLAVPDRTFRLFGPPHQRLVEETFQVLSSDPYASADLQRR